MPIVNHKIIQHVNIRINFLKQGIKKKENLKFNVLFTFFKVFMIFTRPDTTSDINFATVSSQYFLKAGNIV